MTQSTYQQRVSEWYRACFGDTKAIAGTERTHRFLEEALELAQANNCTRDEAIELVDYVFGRPSGNPDSEVGGVLVTLAVLCEVTGLSMAEAGEAELARNWERIDAIRKKRASKPASSPLPQ